MDTKSEKILSLCSSEFFSTLDDIAKEENMNFDFSHLYNTHTFDVTDNKDNVLFSVTAKQVTHGKQNDIQKKMLGKLRVPKDKKDAAKQMSNIQLDVTALSDETNVAGIQSWTLEINDIPVPVTVEMWRELPHYITQQIEEGIKVLNPELDDDFLGESGNNSTE